MKMTNDISERRLRAPARSADLQRDEVTRLCGEVKDLIGSCQPSTLRIVIWPRQHGLGLDPPLELFVQSLDCIRCPDRFPLAFREAREGEQLVAGLFQAIGDGLAL